jgi:hypothetical protein
MIGIEWVFLALVCWLQVALFRMMDATRRATKAYLDEARLCNAGFAESVELLRYGAVDEAVEMASRWRDRAVARGEVGVGGDGET